MLTFESSAVAGATDIVAKLTVGYSMSLEYVGQILTDAVGPPIRKG